MIENNKLNNRVSENTNNSNNNSNNNISEDFKNDLQKYLKMAKKGKETKIDKKPQIIVAGRSNVGKSTLVKLITKQNVRIGKKPGVTLKPTKYDMGQYVLVDLPGFGFMTGLEEKVQDKIKTEIVRYIEDNKDMIAGSIIVIDAKAFPTIVERWENKKEIPIDIEIFEFLLELKLNPSIFINKMDKIKHNEKDKTLDHIVELFGFPPPWRQWITEDITIGILKNGEGLNEIIHKINNNVSKFKK